MFFVYRPNVDVLTYSRTECDPHSVQFRYFVRHYDSINQL